MANKFDPERVIPDHEIQAAVNLLTGFDPEWSCLTPKQIETIRKAMRDVRP